MRILYDDARSDVFLISLDAFCGGVESRNVFFCFLRSDDERRDVLVLHVLSIFWLLSWSQSLLLSSYCYCCLLASRLQTISFQIICDFLCRKTRGDIFLAMRYWENESLTD